MNFREYICERCGEQPNLYLEEHGHVWLMCDCEDFRTEVTHEQVAGAAHFTATHNSPWQPKEEVQQSE